MIQGDIKINAFSPAILQQITRQAPTKEQVQALLDSLPEPLKLLANMPAFEANWSPVLEDTFKILKDLFPANANNANSAMPRMELVLKVANNAPELLEPITFLMKGLHEQKLSPQTTGPFLDLVSKITDALKPPPVTPPVITAPSSPPATVPMNPIPSNPDLPEPLPSLSTALPPLSAPLPSPEAPVSPPLEQAATQSMKKQEVAQILTYLQQVLTSQTGSADAKEQAIRQVTQLLSFAHKEFPATFSNELFTFPISLNAGIDGVTYQALASQVEPLRLAVLLIAAKNLGPIQLAKMVVELQAAVNEGRPALPVVQKWEGQLQVPVIPPSNQPPPPLKLDPFILEPGFAQFKAGQAHSLYLAALDPQEGLLPNTAWQVVPDPGLSAIQSSFLMLGAFPAGFQRAKLQVENKKKASTVFEFLMYLFREDEEIEVESKPNEQNPASSAAPAYSGETLQPAIASPLSGSIDLNIARPFVLVNGYSPDRVIPAPLQVSFKFLVNVVDPKTMHSRKDFLTLNQSDEAKDFRQTVQRIAHDGLKVFDSYLNNLTRLFTRLEKALPVGKQSLESAKHYLRNQVMIYLMGQKRADLAEGDKQVLKAIEASPKGDVMASMCATMGAANAVSGQWSDALIHFADATELAQTKPYFLSRLQEFFKGLQTTFAQPKPSYAGAWNSPVPVLPPGPFDSPSDPNSTALAKVFVTNLKVK